MFFVYHWFGSAIFVGFLVVGANNDRYSSAKLPGWPCTKAGLDQKKLCRYVVRWRTAHWQLSSPLLGNRHSLPNVVCNSIVADLFLLR